MLNLRLRSAARQRGLTLIEMLIGVALIGVLTAVALPEFQTWIANTKIRTASESVLSGMQLARADAVRRNVNVQFAFSTGSSWAVTVPSTGETVQSRSATEGGTDLLTVTRTPSAATKVTFNSLGRTTANADATALLTQVDIDNGAISAAKSRELRIMVGTGGSVRMCDPSVTTTGDPRKC